jgi:hypothetical protein
LVCGLALLLSLSVSVLLGRAQEGNDRADLDGDLIPTWEVKYGGYHQLTNIAPVSVDEAWGVDIADIPNPSGPLFETLFVRRTGNLWRVVQVEPGAQMNALDMAGAADGFAVGERGQIFRFRGWRWKEVTSPTDQRLVDIDMVSPSDGWAVGDRGTILYWDGNSWEKTKVPAVVRVFQISAVAVAGPGEIWASSLGGQLLKYEGDEWREVSAPLLRAPSDMAFNAQGLGMIVGRNALFYDGDEWTEIEMPASTLTSVTWDDDIVYAAGGFKLWQYVDGAWSNVTFDPAPVDLGAVKYAKVAADSSGAWALDTGNGTTVHIDDGVARYVWPASEKLVAIDMITTTLGWAGGHSITAGLIGTSSGAWTESQGLPPGSVVRDIDLVSESDGWAVGDNGAENPDMRMWRWNGKDWAKWPISATWELSNIDMLDSDEGWTNGGNVIARWDGEQWHQVLEAPAGATPGGLSMLSGGANPEGWFGGVTEVFHLKDGVWTRFQLPREGLVFDIEAPDATHAWATTGEWLFQYDGEEWKNVDLGQASGKYIFDIEAISAGNVWLLIDDVGLMHWNGEEWQRHTLAPFGGWFAPRRLRALPLEAGTFASELWMAGEHPSIGVYRVVSPVGVIHIPIAAKAGRLRR